MASITVAGKQYPLGELTGRKALAFMRLRALVDSAGAEPEALTTPEALAAVVALCEAFGIDAAILPLHECIKATREIIAAAAVQWGGYLAGPVLAEIQQTNELAQVVLQGLKGAPNGTPAK
jgi:hypothetical protein